MNKLKDPKPFETVYGSLWVGASCIILRRGYTAFIRLSKRIRNPHKKTTGIQ